MILEGTFVQALPEFQTKKGDSARDILLIRDDRQIMTRAYGVTLNALTHISPGDPVRIEYEIISRETNGRWNTFIWLKKFLKVPTNKLSSISQEMPF